jgi:hypothetical protein
MPEPAGRDRGFVFRDASGRFAKSTDQGAKPYRRDAHNVAYKSLGRAVPSGKPKVVKVSGGRIGYVTPLSGRHSKKASSKTTKTITVKDARLASWDPRKQERRKLK